MFHVIYPTEEYEYNCVNKSNFSPYFLSRIYYEKFQFEKSVLT